MVRLAETWIIMVRKGWNMNYNGHSRGGTWITMVRLGGTWIMMVRIDGTWIIMVKIGGTWVILVRIEMEHGL